MSSVPFKLESRRWYAMLRVMPDGGQFPSPIYVFEVRALKTGKNILELNFWNPVYPGGQGHGLYLLCVLMREPGYLLAKRVDETKGTSMHEALLLTEVAPAWMETHFHQQPAAGEDMQAWLSRKWGYPGGEANDLCGTPPEPFVWASDQDAAIATACALRFDGGRYDVALSKGKEAAGTYESLADLFASYYAGTLELHADFLHNCGIFFWLQRSIKWNGGLPEREMALFLRLFIHLHDQEIPEHYRHPERWRDWSVKSHAARAPELVNRLRADVEARMAYWKSKGTA